LSGTSPDRVRGELRAVVHADERRRLTALGGQAIEHGHGGVGVDAPGNHDRQRLAGVLVDDVQELQDPAVDGGVELEVERPDLVSALGAQVACRGCGRPEPHPLPAPDRHPQPLLAPEALDALAIDLPTLGAKQRPGAAVAEARMGTRDFAQATTQGVVATERGILVALGGAVLAGDSARPPLGEPKAVLKHPDRGSSARRAQKFPVMMRTACDRQGLTRKFPDRVCPSQDLSTLRPVARRPIS
jgi:hypothetical protein